MPMKRFAPILAALFILALPAVSDAQCRSFAKNKCMPSMAP